jgi:hypothetical protein
MRKKLRLSNIATTPPPESYVLRMPGEPPRRAPSWTVILLAYLDPDNTFLANVFPQLDLSFNSKESFEITLEGVTGIFAICGCSDLVFEVVQQGSRSGIQLKSGSPIYEAKEYFEYSDVFWKWIEMKPIPDVMPARIENCTSS